MEIKTEFEPKENDEIFYRPLTANRRYKFTYVICPECGDGRWVSRLCDNKTKLCRSCSSLCNLPKGNGGAGRYILNGYVVVKLPEDSPYLPMSFKRNKNYVFEHRLVMAQQL